MTIQRCTAGCWNSVGNGRAWVGAIDPLPATAVHIIGESIIVSLRFWLCALALLPAGAAAQTSTDEQLWLNVTAQGAIAGDVIHFVEFQPRYGDGGSDLDQMIARGAIGVQLSPAVAVYQGYGYIETPLDGRSAIKENRSFQQLSLNYGNVGRGRLTSRTRLEQRWRSDGDDIGWRLRHQFRYAHPLNEGAAPVAALGWVEGFVNLNDTDWNARSGFDRARAFAGFELPVSDRSTAEVGYMNQTIDNPGGGTTIHHVASISLFLRY